MNKRRTLYKKQTNTQEHQRNKEKEFYGFD